MTRAVSDAHQNRIEDEIRQSSIPYDYDTKEYPIEVINLKFTPPDGTIPTLFIPKYQRDFVWDKRRQCKFVESLFLGVPVPPIFVAEIDEDGTYEIIDGSQRIRTISEYINDRLVLQDLEEIESLNETKFSSLLPARQRKFLNISLRFHVVTDKADLSVRADIFDRLNSNVKSLTPSEIRKGAYATNTFYQFVMELAASKQFEDLTPATGQLERQELVLRFFAYSESYRDFRHDVAVFLNRYIERKENDGYDPHNLNNSFNQMLAFVGREFPFGFRRSQTSRAIPRVRFEALSVGVHLALESRRPINPDYTWLDSGEFKELTTSDASNNRLKLIQRIEFVRDNLIR